MKRAEGTDEYLDVCNVRYGCDRKLHDVSIMFRLRHMKKRPEVRERLMEER